MSGYNQGKITLGVGMKRLAILAVAGLVSVSANATNWVSVFSHDLLNVYVDTDSISKSGQYKSAFVLSEYSEYQQYNNVSSYDSYSNYAQYDCKRNPKKYNVLSSVVRDGQQVVDTQHNLQVNWKIVYPDTVGGLIADFICSY